MGTPEEGTFVTVYSGNQPDADFIKTLLEQNEIPVFIQDEIMGSIYPAFTIGGIRVIVMRKDLDKAKIIVQDFLDTFSNNK